MKIPDGYTEAEVLAVIDTVVNTLSSSFRFGYHDIDDLKQQGRMYAIEVLNKGSFNTNEWLWKSNFQKLYNFLYSHVRNRYINFKRDNYSRYESPCHTCPFFDPKFLRSKNNCAAFEDKMECDKYNKWFTRNQAKKSLNEPVEMDNTKIGLSYQSDLNDKLFTQQLMEFINQELPASLMGDFLRLSQGVSLPKAKEQVLRVELQEILKRFEGEDG